MTLEKKILLDIYQKIYEDCLHDLNSEGIRENEKSLNIPECYVSIKNEDNFLKIRFRHEYAEGLDILFKAIHSNSCLDKIKFLNLTYNCGASDGWMVIQLNELLKNGSIFNNLKSFVMKPESEDTNMVEIIFVSSDFYERDEQEDTVCGLLMDAMPNVEILTLLNSPSKNDLDRKNPFLKTLFVKSVFTHRNFLQNSKNSSGFPNLTNLCFFDTDSFMLSDSDVVDTSFESYMIFLNSTNFLNLKVVEFHNVNLNFEQMEELKNQPLAKQLDEFKIYQQFDQSYDWQDWSIRVRETLFYNEYLNIN